MTIDEQINQRFREIQQQATWWAEDGHYYIPILEVLEAMGCDCRISGSGIDVSRAGNKKDLQAVFRAMRLAGFAPNHRPEAKDTHYSAFFYPLYEGIKPLWLSFSSTVCKRVQVGTELKEVPVYEVQCEESMEIPNDAA